MQVGGVEVTTALSSETQHTPWSTAHGDAFPREDQMPLNVVHTSEPVTIRVDSPGTVRGWLYDVELPQPDGGPIEEFEVPGGSTYTFDQMKSGRLYEVFVNVSSSILGFGTEVTRVFRVRIEPE